MKFANPLFRVEWLYPVFHYAMRDRFLHLWLRLSTHWYSVLAARSIYGRPVGSTAVRSIHRCRRRNLSKYLEDGRSYPYAWNDHYAPTQ